MMCKAGWFLRTLCLLQAGLPIAARADVTPTELTETVKTIASDPFQGRSPGTVGEQKTVVYLTERLKALGLMPAGPNGSWTQDVPMIHNVLGTPEKLEATVAGTIVPLVAGRDIVPMTTRATDRVSIDKAPLVFVGYGVSAPERDWDDYKGVDLRGKIAVYLVNDPDFEAKPQDDAYGRFGNKAMTYYGRWVYKYEEATRRGALGALIIHETGPAGYGWNVASNTVVGGVYALPTDRGQPQPPALEGWISTAFASDLFKRAGLDLNALKTQARSTGFYPTPIGDARLSFDMPVKSARIVSRNVLAKIPGRLHPDETILYGAHWDAIGIGAADAQGRTIHSGANDDGLGVAGLLALARAFAQQPSPERTIAFAFWTAEERGLLGSEYYAAHPVLPLAKTVANLTIDTMQTAGLARDVIQIGAGHSNLDADLAVAAAAQDRTVTPDAKPERGLAYRADHFSFAKRGVPTLLLMGIGGGADLVKGGRAAGDAWVSNYTAHCYHQTCDRWDPSWDLHGAAQDVELFRVIGNKLANSRQWPTWNPGTEFKAAGDTLAALRQR
ncbi:M20/M25/M40 family metallo-hydrolase [Sphingomonas sp.]|uniref:M20/M25/M40 family metallo-hydrolase n=1 Tax=Sphingomonas sp. TaxID=28214 RepID=UPI003B3B3499